MNVYSEETSAAGVVTVDEAGGIYVQGFTHRTPINAKEAEWLAQVLQEAAAASRKAKG